MPVPPKARASLLMYFVYILQSLKSGRRYTGYTNNLERRLAEHNAGRTRSLFKYRPLEIIYTEEYNTLNEARSRERQIKSYRSGEAFKKLLNL